MRFVISSKFRSDDSQSQILRSSRRFFETGAWGGLKFQLAGNSEIESFLPGHIQHQIRMENGEVDEYLMLEGVTLNDSCSLQIP